MKQFFIKKENCSRLILFFAGWGSDENLFKRKVKDGYDYMICFDYQDLEFDFTSIMEYEEIIVLGWSMGVWVANTVLTKQRAKDLKITKAVSFNGTIYPINDNKGIPVDIFKGTMESFSEKVLTKFRRRICGNTENTKEFLSHLPYRDIDSLKNELIALWRMLGQSNNISVLKWDTAVIGTSDKIFPYENQIAAWNGIGVYIVSENNMEHYSPDFFEKFFMNPDK